VAVAQSVVSVMFSYLKKLTSGFDAEKKQWQEDWDDEEVDEDFAKQLRA
jgi:hypothetical protein